MRIKSTTAFTDKQAKAPEDADVPEGKEFTVTAERGAELIALGLAVAIDGGTTAGRKSRQPRNAHKAVAPTPAPEPAPVPAPASQVDTGPESPPADPAAA